MGDFSVLSTAAASGGVPFPLLMGIACSAVIAVLVLGPGQSNDDDDAGSGGGGLMQPAYATVRRDR